MTERHVARLQRQLRLAARRNIHTAQDGRVLAGSVDTHLEDAYLAIWDIHDRIQDGWAIGPAERTFLAHCQELLAPHLDHIRDLEREFA